MSAEVPSDSARTRVIVLVALGAIAFAVVVGVLWFAISEREGEPSKQATIEPAQETSSSDSVASPSNQPTSTSGEPTGEQTDPGSAAGKPGANTRKVAYRVGDKIFVANEDGTEPRSVASAGESYALSPDGRTLAVVVGSVGKPAGIVLVDVATGLARPVGRGAVPLTPAWSPDSKWLAYTAQSGETWSIKGVAADGSGDAELINAGALPAVSSDGRVIAFKTNDQPGQEDPLLVLTAGVTESSVVKNSEGSLSWAWGPGATLYFTKEDPAAEGRWQVWEWKDGKSRNLGATELTAPAYALGDLVVSADGKWLAMSTIGDDDYSRLVVFGTEDRTFGHIVTRRDAYPNQWGSDGRFLYFEGNAYQGEPSALMSVLPDGTGRRTVVVDAQP